MSESIREVAFDTETTGMNFQDGHRIVEIAAIELIDGKETGRKIDFIIDPERNIPDNVIAIHGIDNEKVKGKPTFKELLPEIVDFFRGAKVIAHNSEFDEKFINHELQLAGHPESFWAIVKDTVDTIDMSRKIWIKDENNKNYRHSLDHVLDRCEIDRSERVLHGALIDTELLVKAYLKMKEIIIQMGPTLEDDVPRPPIKRINLDDLNLTLPKVKVSENDLSSHSNFFSNKPTGMKI